MDLTLGEKIMILRKKHKISQDKFAQVLSINRSNLPNYESNRYKPSLEMLIKMADYFNISLDTLVRDKADIAFNLNDQELAQKLLDADKLDEKSRATLKNLIQSFLDGQK